MEASEKTSHAGITRFGSKGTLSAPQTACGAPLFHYCDYTPICISSLRRATRTGHGLELCRRGGHGLIGNGADGFADFDDDGEDLCSRFAVLEAGTVGDETSHSSGQFSQCHAFLCEVSALSKC